MFFNNTPFFFVGFQYRRKPTDPGSTNQRRHPGCGWNGLQQEDQDASSQRGGTLDAGFNPNPRHDGESEEETMAEGPISGYSKTTTSTSSSNRLVRIQAWAKLPRFWTHHIKQATAWFATICPRAWTRKISTEVAGGFCQTCFFFVGFQYRRKNPQRRPAGCRLRFAATSKSA